LVARFAVFLAGRFAAAFFAATSSSQICRAQPVAERVAVNTVPRIAHKRHHNWEIFSPRVANIFLRFFAMSTFDFDFAPFLHHCASVMQ
jgi:hypothetical protein